MAKVMLVEDDNNLREIYEARLQAEGYEIVSAKDGEEALALAVKEKPDLIIADIMMPKISGFDMLDILRSTPETKNTKVIMMTALSQAEDKERANKLGADRYLVKSQVTLEDVAKVARETLEGTPTETADTPPTNNSQILEPSSAASSNNIGSPAATSATTPMPASQSPDSSSSPAPAPAFVAVDTAMPEPPAVTNIPVVVPDDSASSAASADDQPPITTSSPSDDSQQKPGQTPKERLTAALAQDEQAIQQQVQSPPAPDNKPSEEISGIVPIPVSTTPVAASDNGQAPPAGPSSDLTAPEPVVIQPTSTDDKANNDASDNGRQLLNDGDSTGKKDNGNDEEPRKTSTHSKIISPINDLSKDSNKLKSLVAAEEAKEAMAKATTGVSDDKPLISEVNTASAETKGSEVSSKVIQPNPNSEDADPNSIAL